MKNEVKFNVFFPAWELTFYLERELQRLRETAPTGSWAVGNAATHMHLGSIAALEDALRLLKVYGNDKAVFLRRFREDGLARMSQRSPHSDGDRSNGDAYWIDSYRGIMEKIG